jgi:hypothetical protein
VNIPRQSEKTILSSIGCSITLVSILKNKIQVDDFHLHNLTAAEGQKLSGKVGGPMASGSSYHTCKISSTLKLFLENLNQQV